MVDGDPFDFEELLGLGEAVYNADEVIEAAGVDQELADRIWLAMGFAMIPRDQKAFTEADKDALQAASTFEQMGLASRDLMLAITRVLGQSMARISEAEVGAVQEWIWKNAADDEEALRAAQAIAPQVVGSLETFLLHIWRRHLFFAVQRQGLLGEPTAKQTLAIGFADLVGFTRLGRHLDEPGLKDVVEWLESRSQAIVAEGGGRVVKSLGDEVMFAAEEPEHAAEISLALVDECAAEDDLPDLRVGLAYGPVVAYRGDYFGTTVNVASRAVDVARPVSVIATAEVKDSLGDRDAFVFKAIGTKKLKGIGPTPLWVVRRSAR